MYLYIAADALNRVDSKQTGLWNTVKNCIVFLRFPPANISKCLLSFIAHACLVKIPRGCRMVFVRAL